MEKMEQKDNLEVSEEFVDEQNVTKVDTQEESNVDVKIDGENDINKQIDNLQKQLDAEKIKSCEYQDKFKLALADFQNLEKKTHTMISDNVNNIVSKILLDFLVIYDDMLRAKDTYEKMNVNIDGLSSMLKNMNKFLENNSLTPIETQGKMFDPNFHEAIASVNDSSLEENTIVEEMRKGYTYKNTILRTSLVKIAKKDDKIE